MGLSHQRVYAFSGYQTDQFFVGSIVQRPKHHHLEIKWALSKHLRIPNSLRDCGYVLHKDRYLVLFGGNTGYNKEYSDAIYSIDLDSNGAVTKLKHVQCPAQNKYHAV